MISVSAVSLLIVSLSITAVVQCALIIRLKRWKTRTEQMYDDTLAPKPSDIPVSFNDAYIVSNTMQDTVQ